MWYPEGQAWHLFAYPANFVNLNFPQISRRIHHEAVEMESIDIADDLVSHDLDFELLDLEGRIVHRGGQVF